jgi:hypothetical protein
MLHVVGKKPFIVQLDAYDIYTLINALAKDKIIGRVEHFDDCRDDHFFEFCKGGKPRPIPEKIIQKAFRMGKETNLDNHFE